MYTVRLTRYFQDWLDDLLCGGDNSSQERDISRVRRIASELESES